MGEVNRAGVEDPWVVLGSLPIDESYQEMGLALALLSLWACTLEKEAAVLVIFCQWLCLSSEFLHITEH